MFVCYDDVMTNTTEYMTIEQAVEVDTTAGQFWELHPDHPVRADVEDDEGYILSEVELTDRAALQDIELVDAASGLYLLYADLDGEKFGVEAYIDGDTLVRLVDAR